MEADCGACNGFGYKRVCAQGVFYAHRETCKACKGTGRIRREKVRP